jgi:hypothetical protein
MVITYNRLITGLLLILSGVLIIMLSSELIVDAIQIIASFIILFTSIPLLLEYIQYIRRYHRFPYKIWDTIFMIAIGLVLLFIPALIVGRMTGIFLIVLALANMLVARDKMEQFKKDAYRYIFGLILILVNPWEITSLIQWIIGLLLIVTGIILLLNIRLKKKNIKDSNVIDVHDYDVR